MIFKVFIIIIIIIGRISNAIMQLQFLSTVPLWYLADPRLNRTKSWTCSSTMRPIYISLYRLPSGASVSRAMLMVRRGSMCWCNPQPASVVIMPWTGKWTITVSVIMYINVPRSLFYYKLTLLNTGPSQIDQGYASEKDRSGASVEFQRSGRGCRQPPVEDAISGITHLNI